MAFMRLLAPGMFLGIIRMIALRGASSTLKHQSAHRRERVNNSSPPPSTHLRPHLRLNRQYNAHERRRERDFHSLIPRLPPSFFLVSPLRLPSPISHHTRASLTIAISPTPTLLASFPSHLEQLSQVERGERVQKLSKEQSRFVFQISSG